MDLTTHLVLAGRLLEACNLPAGGALFAVLPEMDLRPAHYHRQFANILLYQPTIIDAAIEIRQVVRIPLRDVRPRCLVVLEGPRELAPRTFPLVEQLGDREVESGELTVRDRGGTETKGVAFDAFVAALVDEVATKRLTQSAFDGA